MNTINNEKEYSAEIDTRYQWAILIGCVFLIYSCFKEAFFQIGDKNQLYSSIYIFIGVVQVIILPIFIFILKKKTFIHFFITADTLEYWYTVGNSKQPSEVKDFQSYMERAGIMTNMRKKTVISLDKIVKIEVENKQSRVIIITKDNKPMSIDLSGIKDNSIRNNILKNIGEKS